jgi:hypothetical protein
VNKGYGRKFWLLLVMMTFVSAMQAQEQPESDDRKGKFFLVPEFWLSFGSRTYIEVAPMVGYHIFDRLVVGLGPHYIFQSQKATSYYPYAYQTHVFGLKGFARFALITHAEEFLPINLFSDLFVHAEYEGMSLEKEYYYSPNYPEDGRFIYQAFLVGGGFNQRLGMYSSISFMVLWNLNESSRSPYSNPIFRLGFNAYF